jgi:hypothetical protein
LCERCRQVHYELEKKILQDACIKLMQMHEDYLNQ